MHKHKKLRWKRSKTFFQGGGRKNKKKIKYEWYEEKVQSSKLWLFENLASPLKKKVLFLFPLNFWCWCIHCLWDVCCNYCCVESAADTDQQGCSCTGQQWFLVASTQLDHGLTDQLSKGRSDPAHLHWNDKLDHFVYIVTCVHAIGLERDFIRNCF